jgi:hypothetical protein
MCTRCHTCATGWQLKNVRLEMVSRHNNHQQHHAATTTVMTKITIFLVALMVVIFEYHNNTVVIVPLLLLRQTNNADNSDSDTDDQVTFNHNSTQVPSTMIVMPNPAEVGHICLCPYLICAGTRAFKCSYVASRVACLGTQPKLFVIRHTWVSTGNSSRARQNMRTQAMVFFPTPLNLRQNGKGQAGGVPHRR